MAKDKPEPRKNPRTNVGLPGDWHAVARKLAARRQQPVTYLLISLLNTAATSEGLGDLPPLPWDEDTDSE